MNYYFWGDTHFGHFRIIEYTNRPFKSLKQMNETLIRNFNERVKEDDQVYFLGDFCFRNSKNSVKRGEGDIHKASYYREQLNCKNIVFLKGNHDCFSKKTRILTQKGWRYYNEIKIGDLVPTINLEKKKIEYKPIKNIIVNKVEKAYVFKTKTSEGIFSNNHRHLVMRYNRHQYGSKLKIKTSKDIWNYKSFFFLLFLDSYRSGNKNYFILNNWLKLIAWIFTDGGIEKKHHYITIYQSKPKGIKQIKKLLDSLKIEYTLCKRQRYIKKICGKVLKKKSKIHYEFKILAKSSKMILKKFRIKDKYNLPVWIFRLSDNQVKLFLNELVKGDGNYSKTGTKVLWGRKNFLYQILALCITHGIGANLVKWEGAKDTYYLAIHKKKENSICNIKQVYPNKRFIIDYNNIMWDINVENHLIFTELNGKPLITGNSNNSLKTPIEKVVLKLGGFRISLTHNPAHFDPNYDINFCGHIHQLWKFRRIFTNLNKRGYVDLINTGVDVWDFRPVSFEEIFREYHRWIKRGAKNENYISI